MISSTILILFFPLGSFPFIPPSSTVRSVFSCLRIWPIHLLFLFLISDNKFFFSFRRLRTSALVYLSVHFTFTNLLQTHISNGSSLVVSAFFMVQVSDPYKATLHTRVLTNLFFTSRFILLWVFFGLLKALFAIPIVTRISFSEYPDNERMLPRYLNSSTCYSISPSTINFAALGFPIFMIFVFLMFIFMPYFFTTLFVSSNIFLWTFFRVSSHSLAWCLQRNCMCMCLRLDYLCLLQKR